MIALDAELAEAKATHARLFDVAGLSKASTNLERADCQSSQIHLGKVKLEVKLARTILEKTQKLYAESPKAAKEVLRRLTKALRQIQLLECVVGSLKLQMSKIAKESHDATGSGT